MESKDKIEGATQSQEPLTYKNFFPYDTYRTRQEEVIREISDAITAQKNVLLIASNGTGKTIMALSAILPIALREKKKIIFCSRTFTQNARVIEESKEITKMLAAKKVEMPLGVLSLRGRNEMCVHKMIKRLELPPHESMNICNSLRKNKKCQYFNEITRKKKALEGDLGHLATIPQDAQDLMDYADQQGFCPYYLSKILMRYVEVIVCNYQWVFEPDIRQTFLETIKVKLEDCIIIMDECHNLPEMANEINSYRLTPYTVRQALKDLEVSKAEKQYIQFVKSVREILESTKDEIDGEVAVDSTRLLNQIISKNNLESVNSLKILAKDLLALSETMQKDRLDQGVIARDFLSPIAEFFLQLVDQKQNPAYFLCMTVGGGSKGKSVALELLCMNPRLITDSIFSNSYATLSLSGTIHPFTFSQLLGLNEIGRKVKIIKMPPPFPKENAQVLLLGQLTTKGNQRTDEMYKEIVNTIQIVLKHTPKNAAVFCASYEVLKGLWDNGFKEMAKSVEKEHFREQSENSAADNELMIKQFKERAHDQSNGAVLLGVCGGRNSEGEDFPGDEMNAVLIAGIPFQKPTPSLEARIKYYDTIFSNRGREFAYTVPALQRANQACGRPIRRTSDRAMIILMDYRFGSYKNYLSEWILLSAEQVDGVENDLERETINFFKKRR